MIEVAVTKAAPDMQNAESGANLRSSIITRANNGRSRYGGRNGGGAEFAHTEMNSRERQAATIDLDVPEPILSQSPRRHKDGGKQDKMLQDLYVKMS
jgi:hypothetical protein